MNSKSQLRMMMNQKAINKSNTDKTFIIILSPFMALMAPFVVWPIEQLLPFPYLVEEAVKAVFVYFILQIPSKTKQIQFAILIGVLFSFSEAVLYLFNFYILNTFSFLFSRLVLTTALHTVTMTIMVSVCLINRKLFPFGVVLAVVIHYVYNLLVTF